MQNNEKNTLANFPKNKIFRKLPNKLAEKFRESKTESFFHLLFVPISLDVDKILFSTILEKNF